MAPYGAMHVSPACAASRPNRAPRFVANPDSPQTPPPNPKATTILLAALASIASAADASVDASVEATTSTCTTATPACVTSFCSGTADNLYANPWDTACASYIQCYNGGAAGALQACPAGLVFNPTPKYCDWSYNYKCPSR